MSDATPGPGAGAGSGPADRGEPVPGGGPGAPEPAAGGPSGGPSPDAPRGMSTGAKVLFACLGLTVVGILAAAVAVTLGGIALKRGVESAMGGLEEQQEASRVLRRVEEENPFQPPDDGAVGEARLERFLAVTGDAWEEIRPWAEDLEDLREAAAANRTGVSALRDLASGARAVGGLARSRVALVEALDAHDMGLAEYIWTGVQLDRAADAAGGGRPTESVPAENLELVRARAEELPRLGSEGGDDPGVVLAVAVLWGMSDLSTWQAMGLDTLTAR